MDTKTIQVIIFGNKVMDIEIAVYENTLITLYNNRIYQGGQFEVHIYFDSDVNKLKNGLVINHPAANYWCDCFVLIAWSAIFSIKINLRHNPDKNDEIGSFIRANGLFGTSNEYVLK